MFLEQAISILLATAGNPVALLQVDELTVLGDVVYLYVAVLVVPV